MQSNRPINNMKKIIIILSILFFTQAVADNHKYKGYWIIVYVSLGKTIKDVPTLWPTLDPKTNLEVTFKDRKECEDYMQNVLLLQSGDSVVLKVDPDTNFKYLTNQSHTYNLCHFVHKEMEKG